MNLRQLECFVAVAEEGSFTRAAERVGIAQPSLSQHIRALEEELNGSVVARLPHGAALTPAGRSLLPEARAALRAVERARRGSLAGPAPAAGGGRETGAPPLAGGPRPPDFPRRAPPPPQQLLPA